MMRLNEIAAEIHRRMCEDERFGYSWEERYGFAPETWVIDGREYVINIGDYECGTSVKTAWAVALQGTPWEGCLDGYVWSGNAIDTYVGSGLFDLCGMDFTAQTGDVYVNVQNHVAMCQSAEPDVLSEFSWGDNGAYGNQRGDQTGWESSVHGYYDYPWDAICHYNGKADGSYEEEPREDWPVQMWPSNGTDAQLWHPEHNADGTVTLINKATGKALDVTGASATSGTRVQVYTPNGTPAQRWLITPKKGDYAPDSVHPYTLTPMTNKKLRLDVQGASDEAGATVQVWKRNNTAAQEWYMLDAGNGWWTIVNNSTGAKLCLDVVGGGK